MEFRGLMGLFYRISDWVTRVVYLNLLWILFSLSGAVILGVMPAAAAMFGVATKWVSGDRDFATFTEFKRVYKRSFARANGYGWGLVIVCVVFLLDIRFFAARPEFAFEIMKFISTGLFIVYLLCAIYVFPILTRYPLPWTETLRLCFVIAMTNLFRTLLTGIGTLVIIACGFLFPSFGMLAGASLVVLWVARNVEKSSLLDGKVGKGTE